MYRDFQFIADSLAFGLMTTVFCFKGVLKHTFDLSNITAAKMREPVVLPEL